MLHQTVNDATFDFTGRVIASWINRMTRNTVFQKPSIVRDKIDKTAKNMPIVINNNDSLFMDQQICLHCF